MLELNKIYLGDCLELMDQLDDCSVDSWLADAPYGLEFMGQGWDNVVPGKEYWAKAFQKSKPGANLMAFGGTRTFHRLMCAIEDAGWEIKDTVCWLYGQGFPKGYDISKGIDKKNRAEREVVGTKLGRPGMAKDGQNQSFDSSINTYGKGDILSTDITAPATEAAKLWHGWNVALKPAWEPIVVARKPVNGGYVNNALKWGVSGLCIDGGRIGIEKRFIQAAKNPKDKKTTSFQNIPNPNNYKGQISSGRWPANVILTHTEECILHGTKEVKHLAKDGIVDTRIEDDWECAPDCPVRLLGEQSGERPPGCWTYGGDGTRLTWGSDGSLKNMKSQGKKIDDTGTAARFFYQAKASPDDRGNKWLKDFYWKSDDSSPSGFIRVTRKEWERLDKSEQFQGNIHPTVKPISLLEYLCKLLKTPKGGILVDPFAGTGTTARAIMRARTGQKYILMEIDPDYFSIAKHLIEKEAQQSVPISLF